MHRLVSSKSCRYFINQELRVDIGHDSSRKTRFRFRNSDCRRNYFIGSHPASVQSLTTSSTIGVTTSVMSEIIGPEVTGESAENRLAAAWKHSNNAVITANQLTANQNNQDCQRWHLWHHQNTVWCQWTVISDGYLRVLQWEWPAVFRHGVGGTRVIQHQRTAGRKQITH